MERLPPIPPNELHGDQKQIYEEISAVTDKMFTGMGFKYKRSDGALIGPFASLLYTPPPVAQHFLGVATALGQIPGLPPAAREAAIIATGAQYGCKYEMYAHERVAASSHALEPEQIKAIAQGKKPEDADEGVSTAYDVTVALTNGKGPLNEALWQRAKDQFGQQGAAALVHYVGVYCYTCMVLNGFDVPAPED